MAAERDLLAEWLTSRIRERLGRDDVTVTLESVQPLEGPSPLRHISEAVDVTEMINEYVWNVFRRGAMPPDR